MTNSKCTLIIDSGADVSLFKCGKISQLQPANTNIKYKISGITEGFTETIAETTTKVRFNDCVYISHAFQIVNNDFPIPTDGILGRDFLIKHRCNIDYEYWLLNFNYDNHTISIPIEDTLNKRIILPPRCEVVRRIPNLHIKEDMIVFSEEIQPGVFCANTIISPTNTVVKFINTTDSQVLLSKFIPATDKLKNYTKFPLGCEIHPNVEQKRRQKLLSEINFSNTPSYIRKPLQKLIEQNSDIFCTSEEKLTTNNFYTQNIHLKDPVPVYIPNYKNIHSQNGEIRQQIQAMLEEDIIEPSISSYNSPILLVPKKSEDNNKKWRLVVDFRQLNKKILADKFPLPRINDILDQLGRAKYFSTLDLKSGFHQIPLDPEARKYTAFSTASGHFNFKRLPFGLNISPNSFQRMMNIAMAGLNPECAFIYIDDIIVIGCSINHHLNNLKKVFERLRHYNLKLNPTKCKFFCTEVIYLGHKITDKGILPDSSKFQVIKDYPIPTNADAVRRFVAFCNYYRKFVPNFAQIAQPLNNLLKKGVKFCWNDIHQNSFNKLKQILISPTILRYPDFSKTFIVTTDASDTACGAILSQNYGNDDLPIAYGSKGFTKGERNKPTIEKELTAIHWAVNHFKGYLYGKRFVVRTDHKPLVYLFNMKNPTSKLTRMRLDLEEFDFDVEFISGKNNVGADALSRIAISSEELKNFSILTVNTRAMTRKQGNPQSTNEKGTEEPSNRIDHLKAWQTENPSETTKLLKLGCEVHRNQVSFYLFNHNYKKILGKIDITIRKGSHTLEYALLEIEKIVEKYKRDKLAISLEDKLFKILSAHTLKEIANRAISKCQLILFIPPKILTSKEDINEILHNFHMTPTSGHIGQHRMYLKIREIYKWKRMKLDISNYVKQCEICKINKIHRHTREKQVITTTPSKPLEVLSADTVGPFMKTDNGNRYILTLQCNLTKYVIFIPIPTKEATTIAKAIVEHFILIYGKFTELRTDQGTEYNNEILEKICNLLSIKRSFSTAYHPQSIGALERNHRCLNEYLRCFVNEHQSDWDDWVKYYTFNFNTTPHVEHNFTPFELVFGHRAKLPHDFLNSTQQQPIYNIEQYYNEVKFKLFKTNEVARENLLSKKNKRQSENNLNPITLKIGDTIYITNENRKKLDPFYIGPYIVKEVNEPNCTIANMKTNKQTIVHKNRIIKT